MKYEKLWEQKAPVHIAAQDIAGLKDFFIKKQGWVYIAQTLDNGYLKIGRTGKNPLQRARSLSSTGVFNEYQIKFSLPVFNQFWVEKTIHSKLKKYRVGKEFFSVQEKVAIECMQDVVTTEQALLERFVDTQMLSQDLELLPYAIRK